MPSLQFKGKQLVQNHHLVVPFHELKPIKAKSVVAKDGKVSLHDNVIIHGDNLAALKALLPTHHGKIKCIYIDPPYNTGNEGWVYNDNVNDPMFKEWFGKVVDKEDLTRHDKWLCMMWPRLRLLKDLLAEDGAIVIHIDENECNNLRSILGEIFNECNFLGEIIWDKRNPKGDSDGISYQHEAIICFAKSKQTFKKHNGLVAPKQNAERMITKAKALFGKIGKKCIPISIKDALAVLELKEDSNYFRKCTLDTVNIDYQKWLSKQDNLSGGEAMYKYIDEKGEVYRLVSMAWPNKKKAPDNYFKPLKHPTNKKLCPVPAKGWRNPPETMADLQKRGLIVFGSDEQTQPQRKYLLKENMSENIPSLLYYGASDDALLSSLGIDFDTSKPVDVAAKLIRAFSRQSDIILDSFAGSGTTAHAVLALNKKDVGNRKFILIETLDYADTITAERVRRVIKGVPKAKDEDLKTGLGGTFSYFELGKPVEIQTILNGKNLPTYKELSRYVFFMATGEEWNEKELDAKKNYIGESRNYHVYLFYQPDVEYLKNTALTLDQAEALPRWKVGDKRRLIFAPTKYLDPDYLDRFGIDFARLPYEIYQLADSNKKTKAGA